MRQSTTLLQLQALQTCLFLSVQLDGVNTPLRVATRPWLALQAKAMVKIQKAEKKIQEKIPESGGGGQTNKKYCI